MLNEKLRPSDVEFHSVDWIPHDERFGASRDLVNVWFVGNVNLTAMATGVVAFSVGCNLIWTLIAIFLGSLFGTFFMAFHSAQGPQLGLPQLVQSRAQFGYLGAVFTVWIFALANYVAYNSSDAILSGSAMQEVFNLPAEIGFVIAAVVASIIAIYGYSQIHLINQILFWPSIMALAIMTIGSIVRGHLPADSFDLHKFNLQSFMSVFVIISGFQIGWAPYVSDYSRYLPATIGVKSSFWATFLASGLSGVWVFALGAVASAPDKKLSPIAAFKSVGDSIFNGFGTTLVGILLVGLLSIMAINAYGGSLTFISMADSFRRVKPTKRIRFFSILAMGVMVWSIAHFVGEDRFNVFYGNALVFLAYVFTPWTAINLVDYFFVRKGVYVIKEIFSRDGIYGRWGWRGNLAYGVGISAMIPFFVTTPYVGICAKLLGGVDYSYFVGLPISGLLYLALAKGINLQKEQDMAKNEGSLTGSH